MKLVLVLMVAVAIVRSEEEDAVTCGSVIKLKHLNSDRRLHSHEVNYGSGSGQQSVTGMDSNTDANSFWVVKSAFGNKACDRGDPIQGGDKIRLEHLNTGKFLHSHRFSSPISSQQEVSGFAHANGEGDNHDNWLVEVKGAWRKGKKVGLKHITSNKWLSSNKRHVFPRPIQGQLEIACSSGKDLWVAEEGVYFSKAEEFDEDE